MSKSIIWSEDQRKSYYSSVTAKINWPKILANVKNQSFSETKTAQYNCCDKKHAPTGHQQIIRFSC